MCNIRQLAQWSFWTMFIAAIVTSAGCAERLPEYADIPCKYKLKQLGLSLHSYREDHGALPPIVVKDANGRPMHSWRVLLLPYLDDHGVYAQYDMSLPWDSEHNRKVIPMMPDVFNCSKTGGCGLTPFLAVVDAWNDSKIASLAENSNESPTSILLVECNATAVPWTAPMDEILWEIDCSAAKRSEAIATSGATNVLLSDGSVRGIANEACTKQAISEYNSDRNKTKKQFEFREPDSH